MANRRRAIFPSSWVSSCAAALLATCWTSAAEAGGPGGAIDVSASRLPEAIAELSRETGVSIGAEGGLPELRTPAVHGAASVGEALGRLLAGTGLTARKVGNRAWRIERVATPARPVPAPPRPSRPVTPSPAEAIETVDLDPIVVTAAKRLESLDELPMAVSVRRPDRLRAVDPANGTSVVAAESEGLAMTALGPGRNRLFLRGVADSPFTGESQSTVAVVLDEARLTYAAPDPDIRLIDVDRIEVLKGPQGSLYGTGALGGIYHIVTRRAQVDDTSLSLALNGDTVAHGGIGHGGAAIGNLPIVPGALALRLVGYSAREAGWVDTGARKDANTGRLLGGRANLGAELGGGWRADLSGLVQLLASRDSRYVYAAGARERPAQLPEPHDNDMRHLAARLARSGNGVDITLSTGMSWHEVGDRLDATVGAASFGLAAPRRLDDDRFYRVWDSEARVSGRAGDWRWLVGVNHVEARQKDRWTLESASGAQKIIDDDHRKTRDSALFGDVTVPLGGRLTVDAGARLFRSTVIESRLLPSGMVSRQRHRSGVTPSLALSWRPGGGQLVYLRYASALRQGGSDITAAGGLESLKGDTVQTIEAGWRGGIGGGGRFDLGLFATRWENLQSDLLQPNGLIESANAGDARIVGAEASLGLPLGRSWRMEAGANFTDALLVRNRLGRKLDDRRLPVVPRLTARASLSRALSFGRVSANLRGTVRYVGPQRLSFDPVVDRPMGGYFETSLGAEAHLDGWRLSLTADNLVGGARDSFAFGNSLRFATMRQYTPQRPAAVSLGLGVDF